MGLKTDEENARSVPTHAVRISSQIERRNAVEWESVAPTLRRGKIPRRPPRPAEREHRQRMADAQCERHSLGGVSETYFRSPEPCGASEPWRGYRPRALPWPGRGGSGSRG